MFVYKITNKINNKAYIGITNNFDRRMQQHKTGKTKSLIHEAIVAYGENNFDYSIISYGLSIEEAEKMEIKLIRNQKTLYPLGYNLAKGGLHGGTKNKISDEQILYIKQHRNIPMYLLYDKFTDIISYGYFKQIYHNRVRPDISTDIQEYENNLAFSCQFTKTKMTYEDIIEIRQGYANSIEWKKLYVKYADKVAESTFFDIYRGLRFKLIMPEVFTAENKRKNFCLSRSGERHHNAKLKAEDVKKIRLMHDNGKTNKEISAFYPQVSSYTISDIIRYKTWKNI